MVSDLTPRRRFASVISNNLWDRLWAHCFVDVSSATFALTARHFRNPYWCRLFQSVPWG